MKRQVLIVTGLSGAGKTTTINALEDLGYYCIDNLPPAALRAALEALREGNVQRVAFGIDVRAGEFLRQLAPSLQTFAGEVDVELTVLFLDAADEALLRRFSATRRPHPITTAPWAAANRVGSGAILDGVAEERSRIASVREMAHVIIDTSELTVHDLRARVLGLFGEGRLEPKLRVRVVSFGFKYSLPVDVDMILDVRFLRNPYFVEELRAGTGLDEPVRAYVMSHPDAQVFLVHAQRLLEHCLPRMEREGRAYVTIAVGCTGGQHRSVAIAEALASGLRTLAPSIEVEHRELARYRMAAGRER